MTILFQTADLMQKSLMEKLLEIHFLEERQQYPVILGTAPRARQGVKFQWFGNQLQSVRGVNRFYYVIQDGCSNDVHVTKRIDKLYFAVYAFFNETFLISECMFIEHRMRSLYFY